VIDQLDALARSKHLHVDVEGVEHATVSGDAGELRRALVNLFANAVTWSRDNGTIRIDLANDHDNVRIRVIDEGFGVPADVRESLFKRFGGEHSRGGGTGLGLYIVRRIAEQHGDSIRYEPNRPQGSIFTLELPALPVAVQIPA